MVSSLRIWACTSMVVMSGSVDEYRSRGYGALRGSAPLRQGRKLLRGFAQRLGIDRVVELRPLPLRTEQALLDSAAIRRADLVSGGAQVAQVVEADVDDGRA